MKTNIKFISKIAFSALLISSTISCEDDDPLSAGDGDPLNENVIELVGTISTDQPDIGESNFLPFSVNLPQSFSSDATVTARVLLDNGRVSTGTAVVASGQTDGSGLIQIPPDDGFFSAALKDDNAGTLTITAIALDSLERGNAYVISSNVEDINIWARTEPALGGLNIVTDWIDADTFDIDSEVIDEAFTTIFETGASGSRFEADLFQNAGREDGNYDVYLTIFSGDTAGVEIPYVVNFTRPDGTLVSITGTLPEGAPLGTRIPVARFSRVTDEVTGVTTYPEIFAL